MAPGTRPNHGRSVDNSLNPSGLFEEAMEGTEATGDPWLGVPGANASNLGANDGFSDSFVVEAEQASGASANGNYSYESNPEYLNYLEAKLKRIEGKRKAAEKLSSNDVLKSLKDVKEKQLDWNFRQGISSSEDDVIDSDSSGGAANSLTSELRRKMFPEQHALNETELLHLLEHDVIGKIFNQLEPGNNSNSKN